MNTPSNAYYPRWLSITDATSTKQRKGYTSMSERTLTDYIKDGRIYGTKKGGKWYIDRMSIDDFMNQDRAEIRNAIESFREKIT